MHISQSTTPTSLYTHLADEGVCVEEQLRSILNEFGGLVVSAHTLAPRADLFAAGLTSFATVGVMLAIEEAFDVAFPDALLTRATFKNIESLSAALRGMRADA